MRLFGKTEQRVIFAILITALIPLLATFLIAEIAFSRISATAFQPEFGERLDRSLEVYADLARSIKQGLKREAQALAGSEVLRQAAEAKDKPGVELALSRVFLASPEFVSARVETCEGELIATKERNTPIDPSKERGLTVRLPVRDTASPRNTDVECTNEPMLTAVLSAPRARLDELDGAQSFAQAYHEIERTHREDYLDRTYRNAALVLVGFTILLATAAGVLVMRPVVSRLRALMNAMLPVAQGDLSVRVDPKGEDEVAELGRSFDRMLEELEGSRARIDFLKRMSEWQKMARRLAHEIKNPLTPIQLAVEECHRRYRGEDPEFQKILSTTLEVVEDEVASLRRLVGEFSNFARLPQAELASGDLSEFLRDQADQFVSPTAVHDEHDDRGLFSNVTVHFDIPREPMPVLLDREMLHRALTNIIRNGAQALRDARKKAGSPWGFINVRARQVDSRYVIEIEDDGPGVSLDPKSAIFDPYVTTKSDGTGLGLCIVKKIIVDHGGSIEVDSAGNGGALFRIRLPKEGTPEAAAALERVRESERPQA